MIKLNLLPESYKNRHKIRIKRLGSFIIVLSIFVLVFFWGFYSYIGLKQKEIEYKNLLGEYNVIEKRAKDAQNIKKELDTYKQQLLSIVKFVKDQPLLSRVLNDLGTYIPDDVWIVNFKYSAGDGFSLKGYALSAMSPTKFVNGLLKSNYFREIRLGDVKEEGDLYYFVITGKLSFD